MKGTFKTSIFVYGQTSFIYVIELSRAQFDFLRTTKDQNIFSSSERRILASDKLHATEINRLTVDVTDEKSKTSKIYLSDDSTIAKQIYSVLDPTSVEGYPKDPPPNRLGFNEKIADWKEPGMKSVDHLTKQQTRNPQERFWGVVDGWHRVLICQVCFFYFLSFFFVDSFNSCIFFNELSFCFFFCSFTYNGHMAIFKHIGTL